MTDQHHWLDAMHLASASLPIGGFAYSQGLEQACHAGTVHDLRSAKTWINDYLLLVIARQEMPWWKVIYDAAHDDDWMTVESATRMLNALRETAELRLEAMQMGHAMVRLYDQWQVIDNQQLQSQVTDIPDAIKQVLQTDYTAAHAALCGFRRLELHAAMTAWIWSWIDNQVLGAVKLVPLGQQDGQLLIHALKPKVLEVIEVALNTVIANIGSAPIGLILASTQHETQYARLFRS